ncbi:hypothetical protein V8Z80_08270 [Orrella sp. JC864]|uniref:hypothetical protein n=1 Tax=Orrella sp. JC864 TaxID=3120298 RepID=UPI00300B1BB8
MSKIEDGGPAFPGERAFRYYQMGDRTGTETVPGMSLRDYFAAKFSAAWVLAITASHPTESREAIGIEANRLGLLQADAMIRARTQEGA